MSASPRQERADVGIYDPVHRTALDSRRERVQRIMLSAPWPESVRKAEKILFIDRAQHRDDGLLHDLIFDGGNPARVIERDLREQSFRVPERQLAIAAPQSPPWTM